MQQKRWIRFATLVMAVIAAYALAVSLLVPRLVERELKAMLEAEAGLSLTMGSVSVNPFTLSLSVTDFSLFGGENTPEVSIERLVAGIHVLSAFERTWILREVELIRPRLVLRYSGGEAAGFSRLSAALSRLRDRKPSLANASIAVFTVHSGELQAPGRPAPAG
ncbi:MAG TPA: hypothetical protein PKK10_06890, partial [Woeseiaceae bacterium]|nr:hypothetical protein [Woeseiaceae bacterium]